MQRLAWPLSRSGSSNASTSFQSLRRSSTGREAFSTRSTSMNPRELPMGRLSKRQVHHLGHGPFASGGRRGQPQRNHLGERLARHLPITQQSFRLRTLGSAPRALPAGREWTPARLRTCLREKLISRLHRLSKIPFYIEYESETAAHARGESAILPYPG